MVDHLIKKTLDNTTFKSPSGNVPLELNDTGKEALNDLKELITELAEHRRWEEENKVRIITNEQFTDYHLGKWSSEEGYNYYSIDGNFLFYG